MYTKYIILFSCMVYFLMSASIGQNIGIGTSTPMHTLDVNGDMRIRSLSPSNTALIYFQDPSGNTTKVMGQRSSNIFSIFDVNNGGAGLNINTTNGNVGIEVTNPQSKLELRSQMRIRYNVNTPGIWMEGTNNTLRSFLGVVNDSTVGYWGNGGAGWNFTHNIRSGNTGIGLGTSVPPAAALDVNGTVRLRLPNAKKGSVLASDDTDGTVKWQNAVAFRQEGLLNSADVTIPFGTWAKLYFDSSPTFNIGSGLLPGISTFVAPETGIYQFTAQITSTASVNNAWNELSIKKETGTTIKVIATTQESFIHQAGSTSVFYNSNTLQLSTGHVKLLAGDKVYVEMFQNTNPYTLSGLPNFTYFSGELISRL